jgi:hypothetical protein
MFFWDPLRYGARIIKIKKKRQPFFLNTNLFKNLKTGAPFFLMEEGQVHFEVGTLLSGWNIHTHNTSSFYRERGRHAPFKTPRRFV